MTTGYSRYDILLADEFSKAEQSVLHQFSKILGLQEYPGGYLRSEISKQFRIYPVAVLESRSNCLRFRGVAGCCFNRSPKPLVPFVLGTSEGLRSRKGFKTPLEFQAYLNSMVFPYSEVIFEFELTLDIGHKEFTVRRDRVVAVIWKGAKPHTAVGIGEPHHIRISDTLHVIHFDLANVIDCRVSGEYIYSLNYDTGQFFLSKMLRATGNYISVSVQDGFTRLITVRCDDSWVVRCNGIQSKSYLSSVMDSAGAVSTDPLLIDYLEVGNVRHGD